MVLAIHSASTAANMRLVKMLLQNISSRQSSLTRKMKIMPTLSRTAEATRSLPLNDFHFQNSPAKRMKTMRSP